MLLTWRSQSFPQTVKIERRSYVFISKVRGLLQFMIIAYFLYAENEEHYCVIKSSVQWFQNFDLSNSVMIILKRWHNKNDQYSLNKFDHSSLAYMDKINVHMTPDGPTGWKSEEKVMIVKWRHFWTFVYFQRNTLLWLVTCRGGFTTWCHFDWSRPWRISGLRN